MKSGWRHGNSVEIGRGNPTGLGANDPTHRHRVFATIHLLQKRKKFAAKARGINGKNGMISQETS